MLTGSDFLLIVLAVVIGNCLSAAIHGLVTEND